MVAGRESLEEINGRTPRAKPRVESQRSWEESSTTKESRLQRFRSSSHSLRGGKNRKFIWESLSSKEKNANKVVPKGKGRDDSGGIASSQRKRRFAWGDPGQSTHDIGKRNRDSVVAEVTLIQGGRGKKSVGERPSSTSKICPSKNGFSEVSRHHHEERQEKNLVSERFTAPRISFENWRGGYHLISFEEGEKKMARRFDDSAASKRGSRGRLCQPERKQCRPRDFIPQEDTDLTAQAHRETCVPKGGEIQERGIL